MIAENIVRHPYVNASWYTVLRLPRMRVRLWLRSAVLISASDKPVPNNDHVCQCFGIQPFQPLLMNPAFIPHLETSCDADTCTDWRIAASSCCCKSIDTDTVSLAEELSVSLPPAAACICDVNVSAGKGVKVAVSNLLQDIIRISWLRQYSE